MSVLEPRVEPQLEPGIEFRRRPNLLRIYRLEARSELIKMLRMPAFAIPTIAFPILFYVFFGLVFGRGVTSAVPMAEYLLATYGVFGVIGTALFGFGIGVAVERGQGWMLLKRASPMPPGAYFAAKIALSLAFSVIIVAALFALGAAFGGVRMPAERWLALAAVELVGALPFCAMGLAIGYLAGPNSAPAIVNLIYLPLAFASGLWIPVQVLPGLLQKAAVALPPYHFAQLTLKVIGADVGHGVAVHITYLALFTVASLTIARWAYRRDRDESYG